MTKINSQIAGLITKCTMSELKRLVFYEAWKREFAKNRRPVKNVLSERPCIERIGMFQTKGTANGIKDALRYP